MTPLRDSNYAGALTLRFTEQVSLYEGKLPLSEDIYSFGWTPSNGGTNRLCNAKGETYYHWIAVCKCGGWQADMPHSTGYGAELIEEMWRAEHPRCGNPVFPFRQIAGVLRPAPAAR